MRIPYQLTSPMDKTVGPQDVVPALEAAASDHDVACLRWREIAAASPSHLFRRGERQG